jgi:hypothetical protein
MAAARAGDTCHIDVVDRWGNVSGGWLQSSPAIPTLGFCLIARARKRSGWSLDCPVAPHRASGRGARS